MTPPNTTPIFFGQAESCRGRIDDNAVDILNAALLWSSLWVKWISEWSADFQEAILDSLGVKRYKKASLPCTDSAFTITETLYVNNDEAKPALDELRRRLFAALPNTKPPLTTEVTNAKATFKPTLVHQTARAPITKSIPRKNTFANFSEEGAEAT